MDKTISINDDTRKEIAKVVHSACNYLPAQIIATECNYFVNKYGDAIIDVLSEGINPKETCTRLGLCKESIL
ncbi:hypothetical protein ALC62_03430 [Cyphomyrmex costatus]|uniref:Saposin B-type domain-containing protein n=1 Tax=Cyphomyrmex costatus TaxID=456900 RepID=A0A195CYI3_9HYME|nr:hypothetical protein ALC62_03430 [Cyphomyrmex costatus]